MYHYTLEDIIQVIFWLWCSEPGPVSWGFEYTGSSLASLLPKLILMKLFTNLAYYHHLCQGFVLTCIYLCALQKHWLIIFWLWCVLQTLGNLISCLDLDRKWDHLIIRVQFMWHMSTDLVAHEYRFRSVGSWVWDQICMVAHNEYRIKCCVTDIRAVGTCKYMCRIWAWACAQVCIWCFSMGLDLVSQHESVPSFSARVCKCCLSMGLYLV